ncbi:endo alpha-1,4 polygalactosaminidase [Micromonospora sp. SH-82]|uniref:endo alpha-1,4 polygalactosaminidase n=1 Tax=Micromonospora sp. SH-82 TaxID=3132938 RepID=UPI003EBA67AF
MRDGAGPSAGRRGRRGLPVVVVLLLLAGCQSAPQRPPPTSPWPAGVTRHWQWQWQLTGPLDLTVEAQVFLLDPVRTTAAETARLRDLGRRLVCQVSVGSYVTTDPDEGRFPIEVRGHPGVRPDTYWLDVRRWDELRPVLADRFRLCRGKGFTAVLLTDADGYTRYTGFPVTFDDQLLFNRRVADLARSLGLSPGLRGGLPQVAALAPDFDFAVDEECVRLRQCDRLLPFTDAGKPVFHVEYAGTTTDFCVTSVGYGFTSMRKERVLDAWRVPCPVA